MSLKGIFIAINSIDPHGKKLVGNRIYFIAVSYTHLTLPTICSV